jgi:hypothetical protein
MTLIELKKSLHEQIDACDDYELLKVINKMFDDYLEVFQTSDHNKRLDGAN